jgi:methyl-accepting chemotaxis protein
MALREKVIASVVACLVVVLGLSAAYNAVSVNRMASRQAAAATELTAASITAAMAVFGETGDMNGLQMYLKNVSSLPALADVHAVRAPKVAEEFGVRAGADPLDEVDRQVLKDGQEHVAIDAKAHTWRTVTPVKAAASCLGCHEANVEGDVLGLASVTLDTKEADAARNRASFATFASALIALLVVAGALAVLINRLVIAPVRSVAGRLLDDVSNLTGAANELSATSGQMVDGANNQAASLQQTSASLETMAAQTRSNAGSAEQAQGVAREALEHARRSSEAMTGMLGAIAEIKSSSDRTAQILKTIDEIAFQTNLLALNAAVEAARAGDAGRGFAVVAEEVRNLAQRSARAAQETTALIEASRHSADHGVEASRLVGGILEEITRNVDQTVELMARVVTASEEQADGIGQIRVAVGQIDQVSQRNAQIAGNSETASENLNRLGTGLGEVSEQLTRMVGR